MLPAVVRQFSPISDLCVITVLTPIVVFFPIFENPEITDPPQLHLHFQINLHRVLLIRWNQSTHFDSIVVF